MASLMGLTLPASAWSAAVEWLPDELCGALLLLLCSALFDFFNVSVCSELAVPTGADWELTGTNGGVRLMASSPAPFAGPDAPNALACTSALISTYIL